MWTCDKSKVCKRKMGRGEWRKKDIVRVLQKEIEKGALRNVDCKSCVRCD